jgi:hypothetical protein
VRVLGKHLAQACAILFALSILLCPRATLAQYGYDPSNADEQKPGIRYFGLVKDEHGALLPDVSIVLEYRDSADGPYTFAVHLFTDKDGRFHTTLPLDTVPSTVATKCFKAGYKLVQITKRPDTIGPRATVELNCVLHSIGGTPTSP